jgi:5S rRNA maturation endonuclease (ribonuclease M5)
MSREKIIAANPIVEFVRDRGHELKPAGPNFVTNGCPVTEHKKKWHRPVGIDVKKQLWFCNDCKLGGTVIDWVMREKGCDAAQAIRELGGGGNDKEERGQIVCAYDYTDEGGKVIFQICRKDPKSDFPVRRPDGRGNWIWNVQGVSRVLYRLPEVLKAQTVCVAEGEKDCDNLVKLGFVATTNPFGAGKWRDEYSETLRGKDVVVFGDVGDNDGAGERHTKQVIESLAGKAKSIKRVKLPDGFHDVSDYIASLPHETAGDTIRKLIDETPKVETRSAADDEQTDLTSLSSCAVDYPAPPDEAAYYGLAGEIVRRIEPQTEADPVALLVQTVVAFGNVIGRNAHAIADGSQHYTNLNTVLVGETAKGRKGTAWQHVRRLFAAADKGWTERDPIEEKRPIKKKGPHTGEYETEVKDYGVEDKRLLVVEAEFAKVLKVMSREGSTLSPVIRSAWDDGNLRILTKTSPAHATDAHISILGHITRGESRRNLTETESANGFGNRILWVAARRSKCLPEGGEAVPGADLVQRLQEVVEFARSAGELRRSKEARELWASVYPKLSEGKPGLLGAITARAEAQVFRLSNLYALLDCSGTVEVAHLRAALALWAYCEQSAQWVFESGTGNRNADRILAALKAAGQKGLTRLQIANEVFNRNVPRFDTDEALRLLHDLKLAFRKLKRLPGGRANAGFTNSQGTK